jgi:hypothetical protein
MTKLDILMALIWVAFGILAATQGHFIEFLLGTMTGAIISLALS